MSHDLVANPHSLFRFLMGISLLVAFVWPIGCTVPRSMMSLSQVIEYETGRSARGLPPYRCTAGAHRGASAIHMENTLSALKAADDDPRFAFIEFDVQYTKDRQIVLFHDQRLLRLYGRMASVGNADYAELEKMSNGDIALYTEAMAVLHKKLNIEIKSQGDRAEDEQLADAIMADLNARGRETDVMISSISSDVIRYIKSKYPNQPTGQIYWLTKSTYVHWDRLTEGLYERLAESQADYIMLHVVNLRNIDDLLKLKPPGKTIVFWDFEDGIFLVHKDGSDRLWGTSAIANKWQQFLFRVH
ncbi:MAG: glycerophosphodiester phosphodiesterase family protein [Kiritimatiellae bacterium]|nr:glycerophosphodiester phosphodiesterase family protein [Kiritimatiellia bacterium]